MRVVIRYQCGACGWRWSDDRDAREKLRATFPQPAPIIVVPRDMGPCECEPETAPQ